MSHQNLSNTDKSHAAFHRSTYSRILGLLTDGLCGIAAAGIVVVVLIQIVSRLLGHPMRWSEELTRALFIWMIFIGLAASIRHADSARVTVLMEAFPNSLRKLTLPIYVITCMIFFILMLWTGWTMMRQQLMMNEMIATLGWPSWVIGMVMPISAILSILCLIESLQTHRDLIALQSDANQEVKIGGVQP